MNLPLCLSRPGLYRVCPAGRCFAPGRCSQQIEDALAFARQAANRYRVVYCVWSFQGSSWKVVARCEPQ